MLKNQSTRHSPISGMVMEASQGSVISSAVSELVQRVIAVLKRANKRRQCRRLIRETYRAMEKLDERTLHDIGWPGRYEQQDPCSRADF